MIEVILKFLDTLSRCITWFYLCIAYSYLFTWKYMDALWAKALTGLLIVHTLLVIFWIVDFYHKDKTNA